MKTLLFVPYNSGVYAFISVLALHFASVFVDFRQRSQKCDLVVAFHALDCVANFVVCSDANVLSVLSVVHQMACAKHRPG